MSTTPAPISIGPTETVAYAAEHGDRRALLLALRRRLAKALEDDRTQPRDFSPLTLRLKEIAAELEALGEAEAGPIAEAAASPDEPFTADAARP